MRQREVRLLVELLPAELPAVRLVRLVELAEPVGLEGLEDLGRGQVEYMARAGARYAFFLCFAPSMIELINVMI